MKKIRFGVGGVLMMAAMLVSDSAMVIAVYLAAALWHEIGHILAAKLLRVGVKEIRLGFSGARIVTERRLTSYKSEILLSLAGPLANVLACGGVVAVFCLLGAKIAGSNAIKEGIEAAAACAEAFLSFPRADFFGILAFFALSSLIQAILNLLPVKTFDGGRILYCAVASLLGESAGARILTATTAFSTLILWIIALYLMIKVGGGLGIYVFAACVFCGTMVKGEG